MTASARDIAAALGRGKEKSMGPGRGWKTFCPCHRDEKSPSLSVSDSSSGKVVLHCFAGCKSDDIIAELRSRDLWGPARKTWVAQKFAPAGAPPPDGFHFKLGKPARLYLYVDAQGRQRGAVARFEEVDASTGKVSKTPLPVTWCRCVETGEEKWWWKGFPKPKSPYNELEVVKSPDKPILIVEGEKSADAAMELARGSFVVTTWQGGSKTPGETDWSCLKNRDVFLWPDADVPGDLAMARVAELATEVGAKSVRRVAVDQALLVEAGVPQDRVEGWDLADPIPPGLDVNGLIARAQLYSPVGDEVVDRFNRRFALTFLGGQAAVLEEDSVEGIPRVNFLSVAGFKEFYGNRQVLSGKTTVPEPLYWLKHEGRRSYRSVTFKPLSDTPNQYNMWRGFSHEPDPTGSWDLLKEHVLQNVARGDESLYRWVIGWFAHLVQFPNLKLGTSLAVRGKMGTGKTILGQMMGALYRPHYVLVDKPHYVVGQFNSHMAACLLLHADEAFFAGNPANAGLLKGMVTSDTLRIESKGKDSFELTNYLRLYVSSDNSWVVPAGFEERRFAVLDCGEGRIQDRSFFSEMRRQMDDGGYGSMLHDLLRFDLSDVDVGRIPVTDALIDQKMHSFDSVTKFWHEKLLSCPEEEWPKHIVVDDLHQQYVRSCADWGEHRRLDKMSFTRELKKFWPIEIKQVRVKGKTNDPLRAARPWAVLTASLWDHRRRFAEVLGGRVDWLTDVEGVGAAHGHAVPERTHHIPF